MTNPPDVEGLCERLRAFCERANSIINNKGGKLTVGGQQTALAMLLMVHFDSIEQAAPAIRAVLSPPADEKEKG